MPIVLELRSRATRSFASIIERTKSKKQKRQKSYIRKTLNTSFNILILNSKDKTLSIGTSTKVIEEGSIIAATIIALKDR